MVKKVSKYNVEPIPDPCGALRELYKTTNLSIAHDTVERDATKHMHRVMEEVYYVEKGEGQLVVGDEVLDITEGDIIGIPLNTWHYLKKIEGKPFEVLVITHPCYDPDDFIT